MKEVKDSIKLEDAFDNQIWKIVWAGEPHRKIDVEMTYNDLYEIVELINSRMVLKEK